MTAVQVIEAKMKEEQKEKDTNIGKLSDHLITMAEFLSINGHNRKEIYNEYSLKQVFFYFKRMVKIKNQETITNTSGNLVASITATTGNSDSFKKFIKSLE